MRDVAFVKLLFIHIKDRSIVLFTTITIYMLRRELIHIQPEHELRLI